MQNRVAFEVAALTVSATPEKHFDDLVARPECHKVQREVAVALAIVDVDRPHANCNRLAVTLASLLPGLNSCRLRLYRSFSSARSRFSSSGMSEMSGRINLMVMLKKESLDPAHETSSVIHANPFNVMKGRW
jgi:hypothetical protein